MPRLPILCISGPTSTGKSTLTTLLSTLLSPISPLLCRQDNYYLPAELLPRNASGLEDWDSDRSINWDTFLSAVKLMRRGEVGEDIKLADEGNINGVKPEWVEGLKERYASRVEKLRERDLRFGIVEGFMVYVKGRPKFWDLGIFLNGEKDEIKKRREGRDGYATLEGWWQDPPGYFDDMVWPGYVETHGWLFKDGDVEGDVLEEVLERLGVKSLPKGWALEQTLEHVLEEIIGWLEKWSEED